MSSAVERNGKNGITSLDSISVKGFKSLRDQTEIELRPLTLLAGANSSGKSSVMQTVLLLKQTLEVAYDPGPLLLSGPNVRFTSVEQMLWRGRRKNDRSNEFEIGLRAGDMSSTSYFCGGTHGTELSRVALQFGDDPAVELHEGLRSEAVKRLAVPSGAKTMFIASFGDDYKYKVVRSRCTLGIRPFKRGQTESNLPFLFSSFEIFEHLVGAIIHLPGLRGQPERSYPAAQASEKFPGPFTPYVASVIATWKTKKDRALQSLGRALSHLGLTWKVDSRHIDETQVELRVGRTVDSQPGGASDMVNIADAGFGVSQVLPVVVALLVAKRGQVVYLEQPEIHLHPRAQVALAELLLHAAKRGVIVVAETHSHLILKGVQERIASGAFNPALVKLHWFQREEKSGASIVTSADLDENGAFGDWPEDFAAVELDIEDRFLRSAMQGTSK